MNKINDINNFSFPGISYLTSLAQWTKEKPFSLDSVRLVLNYFNNPQDLVPCIIVTGTNGKGSVSAMTSSILGAGGFDVLLNSSPHLTHINERIVLNGSPLDFETISEFGLLIEEACNEIRQKLSFHEALTVCSFLAAKKYKVDWHVLEVGLGGKHDAANIVKNPRISALVSVDYDHQALLGNTLSKIALEKAGIFRKEGLAVIGFLSKEPKDAICSYLADNSMKSFKFGEDYWVENGESFYKYVDKEVKFDFKPSLSGDHQAHNAAVAIAICKKLGVSQDICIEGISQVFWPGRLEHIKYNNINMLVDCSHNPAGINSLITYIKSRSMANINLGFGVLSTKEWRIMVDKLIPYVNEWNLLTPPTESAVSSREVGEYLEANNITFNNFDRDYLSYLNYICKIKAEQVVVTGSIYLVGELRGLLTNDLQPIWKSSRRLSV